MSYQTTAAERGPRISALVHAAESSDVQALLEVAIEALADAELPVPHGASSLAAQIGATFTPGLDPCFTVGQRVRHAEGDDASPALGKITERYLNEHGDWEYQVRSPRFGSAPYGEEELATA
jgi:hypothetical protein